MNFFIKTYGCQMNAADSDLIAVYLGNLGFNQIEEPSKADIIVVNTCSIRHGAEHKVLSLLGRIEPFKKKKPDLKIIVVGCMAERVGEKLKKRFPIIDLLVSAKDIEHFPRYFNLIYNFESKSDTLSDAHNRHGIISQQQAASAFVTIIRGCVNYCSYCIVPYVRGHEISRNVSEIIDEIKYLADKGVKDITLLGQNVNSYNDGKLDFADLLKQVNNINGIERIRFMTSHPKDLSDKLIDIVIGYNKICEHIHLPLQSGSNKILQAMNRRYTAAGYMKIIEKIRKKMPDMNFTTDILVGFPGESKDDFNETVKIIQEVDFDAIFAFKYSPRPGTAAAKLEDDVTREIKESRLSEILETGNIISGRKNAKLINTVQEVLVENFQGNVFDGRTRSNKKVFFQADNAYKIFSNLIGQMIFVKIIEGKTNSLAGCIHNV